VLDGVGELEEVVRDTAQPAVGVDVVRVLAQGELERPAGLGQVAQVEEALAGQGRGPPAEGALVLDAVQFGEGGPGLIAGVQRRGAGGAGSARGAGRLQPGRVVPGRLPLPGPDGLLAPGEAVVRAGDTVPLPADGEAAEHEQGERDPPPGNERPAGG